MGFGVTREREAGSLAALEVNLLLIKKWRTVKIRRLELNQCFTIILTLGGLESVTATH